MELKNWLLLSFVSCFAFYSELAHGMSKRNIHNVIFKQNKDECVCFQEKTHLSNIPKILDPDNKGIERLIIFVYRTEDGNIHAFIPNKNKQSLLPDLQYENGDAFTLIKNEKLATIFSNSNRIIKYPHIGYDTDSFPIKKPINVGDTLGNDDEIENVDSFYNDYNNKPVLLIKPITTQTNYYDSNGKHIPQIDPVTNKLIKNYDDNYGKPVSSAKPIELPPPQPPPTTNVLENSQETDYMTPKYIDNNKLTQNFVNGLKPLSFSLNKEPHSIKQNSQYFNNKENLNDPTHLIDNVVDGIFPNSNNGQDFMPSVVPVSTGTMPRNMSDVTFNKWFIDQMKRVELGKSIKPLNFSTLEHLIQAALKRQGMFISPKGVLTDAQGNILNMKNLHLRPLLVGDLLEYTKVKENPNRTYTFPNNVPYMEALLIAVLHPPKIIGIIPLGKIHLKKTLDINSVLNEHNMKHIEDATSIKNNQNDKSALLEDESLSKNMTPISDVTKTTHTYVNDSKDLKTINTTAKKHKILSNKKPTKQSFKTVEKANKSKFVPNEDISHKIKSHVTHKDNIPHNIHSEISKAKDDHSKFSKDVVVPDPYLSQGTVHSLVALLHKIENEYKNKYGSLKMDKEEKNKELDFSRRKEKSRKQDPLLTSKDLVHQRNVSAGNAQKEDLRKKISKVVLPLLQKFRTRVSAFLPPTLSNKNSSVIVENEDGDDFDPDFRIIGGSAATGSGRPISNRGRSGNIVN